VSVLDNGPRAAKPGSLPAGRQFVAQRGTADGQGRERLGTNPTAAVGDHSLFRDSDEIIEKTYIVVMRFDRPNRTVPLGRFIYIQPTGMTCFVRQSTGASTMGDCGMLNLWPTGTVKGRIEAEMQATSSRSHAANRLGDRSPGSGAAP